MESMKINAVSGIHPYGNIEELFGELRAGRKPFRERGRAECAPAAFDSLKPLGPALRRTPRLARLALAAALACPLFRERLAVDGQKCASIVATRFASARCTFEFLDSLLDDGPDLASPTSFSHAVTNMTVALLSQHLGLTGPALTVTDAGGGAFPSALIAASGALCGGRVDTVFLWAVEERNPVLDAIVEVAGDGGPFMEGAVLFALSRASDNAGPHVTLDVMEQGDKQTAGFIDIHGGGPLAPAWDMALAFLSLRHDLAESMALDGGEAKKNILVSNAPMRGGRGAET